MDYIKFVILAMSISMLVIILVIFGSMLSTKKSDFPFPNTQNQCPDTWPISGNGCLYIPQGVEDVIDKMRKGNEKAYNANYDKIKPILDRAKNIGKNNGTLQTFDELLNSRTELDSKHYIWDLKPDEYGLVFNDHATLCDKQKWANFYGIKWDAVSNYNHCT